MTTKNIHNLTLNGILRAWQLAFGAFFVRFFNLILNNYYAD